MMRRRIAAGVGVLLVIAIVLIVNAIIQGEKTSALEQYNRDANQIGRESRQQVFDPLFAALVGAGGKPEINVDQQINELHSTAQAMLAHARQMSVPGEVAEAQRNLLLALELRAEAVSKVSSLLHGVLGSQSKSASAHLAGAMEMLLASDVIWSQRVTPLTEEALSAAGLRNLNTSTSRSLPNTGWLSPETALSRVTGKSAAEASGQLAPGTHGDAFTSLAASGIPLQAEPALNHLSGGGSATFALTFQNTGENSETNTKVLVSVTAGGKTVTGSHTVPKTEPGQTVSAEVALSGIATGVAAKIEAKVEAVPGESNLENNKASYLAIFE